MQKFTRDEYLEQEVRSAAPQKLQLMLIEAAIRHVQRAKQLWAESAVELAGEAIVSAQEIIVHLLAGLSSATGTPLGSRMAAVYSFMVRSLTKAHLQRDEQALMGVLRVLEIERETWRQVCQQMGGKPATASPVAPHFAQPRNSASHQEEHETGMSWQA